MWTRYELNGQKYGFEEAPKTTPTVSSKTQMNPPDDKPTGQEGQEDFLEVTTSDAEVGTDIDGLMAESGVGNNGKKPLGREVSKPFTESFGS